MNFHKKVVLITGAAVGIGRACALKFAEYGADVVIVDRDGEKLEAVKNELLALGHRAQAYVCDVRVESQVLVVVKKALETMGKIDILVNNAALWRSFHPFVETTTDEWQTMFDINVNGTMYFTRAVLPGMVEQKWGRVINVASVAGVYGNGNMVTYSATKGAVIAMTKALAKEVADKGITVNAVSPGTVSPSDREDPDYTEVNEMNYANRTGSDNENAGLICYLASEEAAYIAGQNIQIDGCRRKL
ncbi:MAG: SDR family oxidoreductase [Clostridia bacterium]|nr:SDR family oxidoreductase [Clostridia bacterium]